MIEALIIQKLRIHRERSQPILKVADSYVQNQKINILTQHIQDKLIMLLEIIDESFRYLGRHFDFPMSNQLHKTELSHLVTSTLNTIDSLPLHPNLYYPFYFYVFRLL